MTAAVRILCIDDNRLVGDALASHFERLGGFEWLGQLLDARDLVAAVGRARPDVVLLDVDMPGRDALGALAELSAAGSDVRVIVLSGHVRRGLVDRAFEAGAWAYLSKNEGPDTIVATVGRELAGEVVLGPDARAALGG
jgi:two-component system, NarL family, response regulator DesR